ncbi:MAG: hypothetical protein MdMp014T_1883 [Treponematales bacterium]
MIRKPYKAESAISPGTGVVQGTAENQVKAPGANGAGDFIGVYPFEANAAKAEGDEIGVALTGVVQVLAGDTVHAGKKAALKADASGAFVEAGLSAVFSCNRVLPGNMWRCSLSGETSRLRQRHRR